MSAILLIVGVWILFANVYGDTALLTSLQVVCRCLLALALIACGLGLIAYETWKLLY